MIDVEKIVFNTVYNAVKAVSPNAAVYGETVERAAKFPSVTVMETDNVTYKKTLDDANHEHHAQVTYEINVYSDKQKGNKKECRAILAAADAAMQGMNFVRLMTTQLPNVDRTIYRMYARYRAIVEEGITEEGTTSYRVYRK